MSMVFEKVVSISGRDTLMLFGNSGTCKTTFSVELLKSAPKPSLYIDTEKNIIDEKALGCGYIYCSSFDMLYSAVMNMKKGYKCVVVDSLGLPVLGEFATKDTRQRGEILLRAESISYMLKKYSQSNECLVIVCNQPVSEFGKSDGVKLDPFGDKSKYFYKEIWETVMLSASPSETRCTVKAYRSRRMGMGTRICDISVSSKGVNIAWLV